jgi:hypothetical protein
MAFSLRAEWIIKLNSNGVRCLSPGASCLSTKPSAFESSQPASFKSLRAASRSNRIGVMLGSL